MPTTVAVLLVFAVFTVQAAQVTVPTVSGQPGRTVAVDVQYAAQGTMLTAIQLDLAQRDIAVGKLAATKFLALQHEFVAPGGIPAPAVKRPCLGTNNRNGSAKEKRRRSHNNVANLRPGSSNPEARRNHCVFWHHDNAVADKIIAGIQIRRFPFRRDHHSVRDPGVLVDNGAVDHTIPPDPDRR